MFPAWMRSKVTAGEVAGMFPDELTDDGTFVADATPVSVPPE